MKNPFSSLRERLYQRFVHKFFARDLLLELQLQARRETLEYINANMRHCLICRNRRALFEYALGHAGREGLVAEFGVARGDSIRLLAGLTGATVHGFDSLPRPARGLGPAPPRSAARLQDARSVCLETSKSTKACSPKACRRSWKNTARPCVSCTWTATSTRRPAPYSTC